MVLAAAAAEAVVPAVVVPEGVRAVPVALAAAPVPARPQDRLAPQARPAHPGWPVDRMPRR